MPSPPSLTSDLKNALRGFLMGAADIVPGVSGGTVALILGIYARLVAAISQFDTALLKLLVHRQWKEAAARIDLRFLIMLGSGILAGVVSLAGLMHYLLENHLGLTYAGFFGLILGSSLLVGRLCRPSSKQQAIACIALGLVAAVGAFLLVSLPRMESPPGLGYTFLCGAIAICAMILPGVSGSYLLVLLGKYHEITGLIKAIPKGEVTAGELTTVAVFALGCLLGLLAFSKLLRWLLARHEMLTMAVLCGFMIGSLYKIWPFQQDQTPAIEEFKDKIFSPYWPESFDRHTMTCVAIAVVATLGVLAVNAVANRKGSAKQLDAAAS